MIEEIFKQLGISDVNPGAFVGGAEFTPSGDAPVITSYNPTTGERLADVKGASVEDY